MFKRLTIPANKLLISFERNAAVKNPFNKRIEINTFNNPFSKYLMHRKSITNIPLNISFNTNKSSYLLKYNYSRLDRNLVPMIQKYSYSNTAEEYDNSNASDNDLEYKFMRKIQENSERGNLLTAVDTFYDMINNGILPNRRVFHSIVVGFIKKNNIQRSFEFFNIMKKYGILPDVILYNALISGCARISVPELAISLFEELVKNGLTPSHRTFSGLIVALGKSGKLEKSFELLNNMKEWNLEPDEYTFKTLIDCSRISNDYEKAKQAFDMAVSNNIETPIVYEAIFNAANHFDDSEFADKIANDSKNRDIMSLEQSILFLKHYLSKKRFEEAKDFYENTKRIVESKDHNNRKYKEELKRIVLFMAPSSMNKGQSLLFQILKENEELFSSSSMEMGENNVNRLLLRILELEEEEETSESELKNLYIQKDIALDFIKNNIINNEFKLTNATKDLLEKFCNKLESDLKVSPKELIEYKKLYIKSA